MSSCIFSPVTGACGRAPPRPAFSALSDLSLLGGTSCFFIGCGPLLGSVLGQADGRLHARSLEKAHAPTFAACACGAGLLEERRERRIDLRASNKIIFFKILACKGWPPSVGPFPILLPPRLAGAHIFINQGGRSQDRCSPRWEHYLVSL